MRGTPHDVDHGAPELGIIPAYAGNTFIPRSINIFSQDHPRICGEHCERTNASSLSTGSSPHMRGTHCKKSYYRGGKGIIPAYAGNTYPSAGIRSYTWDHPRICGEHSSVSGPSGNPLGSSPHMRGTRPNCRLRRSSSGIIPAYAGNTWTPSISPALPWDHPRICGEHSRGLRRMTVARGSSPHMRGTLHKRDYRFPRWRIIPAYAGNTSALSPSGNRYRDHPRICGEHFQDFTAPSPSGGSSPHMRGTLFAVRDVACPIRIIPAYAGNT